MKAASHRIRFVAGVALGAAVGLSLSWALLRATRRDLVGERDRREAIISLREVADLVQRVGFPSTRVGEVVSAWQAQKPAGTVTRIVAFAGAQLVTSTDPADRGARETPRRLSREEKPLYDQGQRIRAAVETNREEASARKAEIEIDELASGALSLAAPLQGGDAVSGLVTAQIPRTAHDPGGKAGLAALLLAGAIAVFAAFARAVGERRLVLAAGGIVCLTGALLIHANAAVRTVGEELRAADEAVAAYATAQGRQAGEALKSLQVPADPPLAPASWDTDEFRRPRRLIGEDGHPDEVALAGRVARASFEATRALFGVAAVSLLLLLVAGFGGFSRAGHELAEHRQAYLYIVPAMIGLLVLVFFPFFYGIALSFTDSNLYNTNRSIAETWIGLRNYGDVLGDFGFIQRAQGGGFVINYLNFYWTLLFTVLWTVSNVAFGVVVGLALALILNTRDLALRPVYRVLLILPWAVPNYITSLIWKGMFHQQFGVVNQFLGIFGISPIAWFQKVGTSFFTAFATNGWLSFPFMMVVSLGALQSIPAELYEAARVDGATRWQQFKAITLPSLRPALVPAIIISVVWTFNMFNVVYLVTAGEPGGSTEILITQAYKFAFERYRYGYAAAYSTVIFLILLVYGVFQNRVSKATEAA
jgi:arabinogalactan oligomer/maltooligosaccharide transport system permease protein